jgi:hypothetical protein
MPSSNLGSQGSFGTVVDVVVTAGEALTDGYVVMLPIPTNYNLTDGSVTWPLTATTTKPATADNTPETRKIFGVVLADAASGARVKVRVRGAVSAYCAASVAAAAPLVPTNNQYYLSAAAIVGTGATMVGFNMVVVGGSAANSPVLFDGLYGFGSVQEA